MPVTVNSSLEVVMWNNSLAEATSLPRRTVESQHISALRFTDEAALDQVCYVRVSGTRSQWSSTKAFFWLNTVSL